MPFVMRADARHRCILVRWFGVFDAGEVRSFYRDIGKEALFRTGAPSFHDARHWNLDVPAREIEGAVRAPAPRAPVPRRVAILAPGDLAYGRLRMLSAFAERATLELDVFRELAPAKAWIGLGEVPGDPFEQMIR